MAKVLNTTVRKGAEGAIRARKDFKASGLTGEWISQGSRPMTGRLPNDDRAELFSDLQDGDVYVVFSYATPIAWVEPGGEAIIPSYKYSATTSRHQSITRLALA